MNWKQPKVYAVKHKDEVTRAASRSGGIFTALSDQLLSSGGVVYGCVLTDDFNAVHGCSIHITFLRAAVKYHI